MGVADTCSVVLTGPALALSDLTEYTSIFLVGDSRPRALFLGPYDLRAFNLAGEARLLSLQGVKNRYWEHRLVEQGTFLRDLPEGAGNVERGRTLEGLLATFQQDYGDTEPYQTWFAPTGPDDLSSEYPTLELVQNIIYADIAAAQEFAAIIQAFERWGITVFTEVDAFTTGDARLSIQELIRVRPLFPVFLSAGYPSIERISAQVASVQGRVSNVVTEQIPAIQRGPDNIDNNLMLRTEDYANRPGLWRTRRIDSAQRNYLLGNHTLFSTGGDEPIIYRREYAAPFARYDNELTRWRLQNEALTRTINIPYAEASAVTPADAFHPHQIVSFPTTGLTRGIQGREDWRIISVTHAWSGGAYTQTLHGALWQGPFVAVDRTVGV